MVQLMEEHGLGSFEAFFINQRPLLGKGIHEVTEKESVVKFVEDIGGFDWEQGRGSGMCCQDAIEILRNGL